jgi:heavy metal sensor kinase
MRTGSLRIRITAWYVGLLALALTAFGLAVYFGLENYLESSLEHSLVQQANAIATNFVTQVDSKGIPWLVSEVAEDYAPESSGRFIRITRQDGKMLYESGDTREPYIDASRVSHPQLTIRSAIFRRESFDGVQQILVYSFPCVSSVGTSYVVEVGASRSPITHVLHSLLLVLLLLTPLILVAAAMGGYLLMTRPLLPVVALTEQAERIGADNFSERLPVVSTGDELERLSLSLNRMLARLEDAITHIHRFSEDVSHELRTPLTILRGELEPLAQMQTNEPQVTEAVGSALEEIERMSKIVESLLAISRLDSGNAGIEKTCVDLRALACETAEQMHVLADEKGLTISCADGPPVEVLGDVLRLKQVVVNLLDNGIKYTPSGGWIKILASSKAQSGVLRIIDSGIGIRVDALPHIFERFYRADKARSRASGGTGLGLSIVRAICSAHYGSVFAESVEGKGTALTVELPLYESVTHSSMGIDAHEQLGEVPSYAHPGTIETVPVTNEEAVSLGIDSGSR